jgi:hypothetical protein
MALKSMFKAPEGSITVGLAEAAAVYMIYQAALPNHTDIRAADPHNTDIEASRKRAAWKAASILGLVFLITQDLNSFLIGGAALAGIDLMTKHANAVHPSTGKISGNVQGIQGGGAELDTATPMPDYADAQPNEDMGFGGY